MHIFSTPIEYLKGVGPARADLLRKELGVFTYGDLLQHFPFRYIDRSRIYNIVDIKEDIAYVQLQGKVISFQEKGIKTSKRLIAIFKDKTGFVELVWFKGLRWIKSSIKKEKEYIVFCKPTRYAGKFNISHPEMDLVDNEEVLLTPLQPVYHSTEKLSSKGLTTRGIEKIVNVVLKILENQIEESLSADIIQRLKLPSRKEAFFNIHQPKSLSLLSKAKKD